VASPGTFDPAIDTTEESTAPMERENSPNFSETGRGKPSFRITEDRQGGILVLTLAGRMDFHARQPFHQVIEHAKHSGVQQLILHLGGLSFVDSAGLGLLMVAHKSVTEAGIRLTLEVPEGSVMQILTLTNIGAIIPIVRIDPQPDPSITLETSLPSTRRPTPSLVFEVPDMQELLLPILEKLEKNAFDLPTLPEVASQVLALTVDPEATTDRLKTIIQQDPVLTTRVFKVANSAAFGTSRRIESLSQAIAWLGLNSVAGLGLALSVQSGVFNDRVYKREVRMMWAHAIATGFYAKSLAGLIGKNQDTAFLCGLLHSIGKLFVVHVVNHSRPSSAQPLPWSAMLTLMEQAYIEVGRQLADSWGLPPSVKEAINLHQHFSYHLATDPAKGAALTCLAKHLATYHVDSVALTKEMVLALPVTSDLRIPHDVMDAILDIKAVIQAQIDSLLI